MHKEVATKEMMDNFRELAKVSTQNTSLNIGIWQYDPAVTMLDIIEGLSTYQPMVHFRSLFVVFN